MCGPNVTTGFRVHRAWFITPEELQRIKELADQGLSKADIAFEINHPEKATADAMRAANIFTVREQAFLDAAPDAPTKEEFLAWQKEFGPDKYIAGGKKFRTVWVTTWRKQLGIPPVRQRREFIGGIKSTPYTEPLSEEAIAKLYNGRRYEDITKRRLPAWSKHEKRETTRMAKLGPRVRRQMSVLRTKNVNVSTNKRSTSI